MADLALGVRYLLQGSPQGWAWRSEYRRNSWSFSGRQLWSETFDRDISGSFAIQTKIAEEVATHIFPQLSPPSAITTPPDVEAYQHFLIGCEVVQKRVTWRYSEAIEHFSRVIEIDPTFADAYAERAIVILLNRFWTNDRGRDLDRAERDVQTARSLNPDLARAYAAHAGVAAERSGSNTEF